LPRCSLPVERMPLSMRGFLFELRGVETITLP
jgi:hypothetical protein